MNQNINNLSITDVAELLGVRYYQITYLHSKKSIKEPPRVANKRCYGPEHIEAVAQALGVDFDHSDIKSD